MKKIFAIALALVMVLSMASAFAWCDVVDWSTSTNCGTGKVEVVTYAKGNKVGGNTWTETACAGAVNGDEVYFAVRVTVDANPNEQFWTNASLELTKVGLEDSSVFGIYGAPMIAAADLAAGTYYVNASGDLQKDVYRFTAKVDDAASAKVCAEIKFSGAATATAGVEINGSTVKVGAVSGGNYTIQVDDVYFFFTEAGKFGGAMVDGKMYTEYAGDVFYADDDTTAQAVIKADNNCNNKDDYTAIKDAMAAINITWGQKISRATAVAKLAKTDKLSDCATWNSEVLAVVNNDCFVMEIPKTGDKSVLAWLF